MNILIFSWRGPKHPDAGGAEISTHEHAKGWIKAGHKVTLFTSSFKGSKSLESIEGIHIIRKGSQFFGVHLAVLKWFTLDRQEDFDLVVDEFHGIPFFAPLFVRGKKLAFIHEVTKEVWKLNSWKFPLNWLPAILGTFFEPLIFKLIYSNIPFMTVSKSTKKELVEWGISPKEITVIQNGISLHNIGNLPNKEKKKTLIFLGTLTRDKGIEDALKVFSLIDQTEKEKWQFWITGKAEPVYLKKLQSQSNQLGLGKRVKFWGRVSEKKKIELLARAHLVVNPSVREGWGLVVIEAAALGVPTVAYNVSGLRDSIVDNKTGIICSENTVGNLAKEIMALIDNMDKYRRISENAKVWSKKFSWEKSTKDSLRLIEKLIKN